MEAPSSIYTREEQQKLLTPHEYAGEVLSLRYQDCISYHRRTEFTCVKCGYCYSCHWRREQIEQVGLRDKLKDFYLSSPIDKQRPEVQTDDKVKDKELGKWGALNVIGQPAQPICNYYGCHHKFSLHGTRRCWCKHPTNKALGIRVRYL